MKLRTGLIILGIGVAALAGLNAVLRVAGPQDLRSQGLVEYYLVGREDPVPPVIFILYAIFSAFLFCQTAHAKGFSGISQVFDMALTFIGFGSFIAGIVLVVLVAVRFSWFDVVPFILLHNAVRLILIPIDQKQEESWHMVILGGSLLGFIVVPASLIAMFIIAS